MDLKSLLIAIACVIPGIVIGFIVGKRFVGKRYNKMKGE